MPWRKPGVDMSENPYATAGFEPEYLVDKEFADAMKRIQDEATKAMTGQLDALYRKAISLHLGTENWKLGEVTKRMHLFLYAESKMTTVTLDGNPILVYGEPTFEGDKLTRKYHIIQPCTTN